jgi:hypothetical protein
MGLGFPALVCLSYRTMAPREVHIYHKERWSVGQRLLDGCGAVGDFSHGTIVREMLFAKLPGKTAMGRIAFCE